MRPTLPPTIPFFSIETTEYHTSRLSEIQRVAISIALEAESDWLGGSKSQLLLHEHVSRHIELLTGHVVSILRLHQETA